MLIKEYSRRSAAVTPYSTTLVNGRHVVVDAMSQSQIHETYLLVQEAAQSGQGFGADEYIDENAFLEDIRDGYQFSVMDKDSGEMVAAFILAISKYSRGVPTADPFIIVKKNQRGCRLGTFCMQLCVEFAKKLDFMGIYCDTFSNNTAMIRIIESIRGFECVGRLPLGGVMKNGTVVGTEIYYKDLRAAQEPG